MRGIPDDTSATETHTRSLTNALLLHMGRVLLVRAAVQELTVDTYSHYQIIAALWTRRASRSHGTRHPCLQSESVRGHFFFVLWTVGYGRFL